MESITAPFSIKAAALSETVPNSVGKGTFPRPLPRRMSRLSKMCLQCVVELVQECGAHILQLPVVYASRHGELDRTHSLFEEWRDYGEMSPAGFSLSVHNATASLLGLASHNRNSSTTLAAGPDSLAMGVLEAAMICRGGTDCLLMYGDTHPAPVAAALLISTGSAAELPQTYSDLQSACTQSSHP